MYGISPLIDQYLRSNNLAADGGLGVLVRRTEIERLPSYPFYKVNMQFPFANDFILVFGSEIKISTFFR